MSALVQPLALLGYGIAALSVIFGAASIWLASHRLDPLDRIPPGTIRALDEARVARGELHPSWLDIYADRDA